MLEMDFQAEMRRFSVRAHAAADGVLLGDVPCSDRSALSQKYQPSARAHRSRAPPTEYAGERGNS